jgi:hypothetical protein
MTPRVAAALIRQDYSRKWEYVCPYCREVHLIHAGAWGTKRSPTAFLGLKVAACKKGLVEILDGRRDV